MRFCTHMDTNKLNTLGEVVPVQSTKAYGGVDI